MSKSKIQIKFKILIPKVKHVILNETELKSAKGRPNHPLEGASGWDLIFYPWDSSASPQNDTCI
ncbi:MAG: hypothetical protein A3H70_03985 [Candidatus Komeilibacteria bacterium RIFCSPLOWO2_02_FULL_48_11]|uniref:Uncharacterized protein n=1 Tax=Candidatus Komeilibacteria bacterium RIFCSPLOWO2_02_FULL_48_11 TaxID=1798553 RepID=A0A1G2BP22_9BACT|nr:MAG: hypothetical protein A3H70_03985 [Candidatus Komeilibacteria bacterium RIFCSPLOWO2_02_FULL_48_11]